MKTKYGYVPDTYIRFFTFPMIWVNQEEFEELSLQFARLAEGKVDYELLFNPVFKRGDEDVFKIYDVNWFGRVWKVNTSK